MAEPSATPIDVVRYKASQMEDGVLVEDTSLDVAGQDVGVNVKWLISKLDRFTGSPATVRVILGVKLDSRIQIYVGKVHGHLVSPRGEDFGFDPEFQPNSSDKTLGEAKPDAVNARALAVRKVLANRPDHILQPLADWHGEFQ